MRQSKTWLPPENDLQRMFYAGDFFVGNEPR